MVNIPFGVIKPVMHALDPERAHGVSICAMKAGLAPSIAPVEDPRLRITLWERNFRNPVGLAAGFDKNAEVIGPMLNIGFGFVEVGTGTPRAQDGNPRPRVFRNVRHEAVINRMGFPNAGLDAFKENIEKFLDKKPRPPGIVGINIGMNKTQDDPAKDYCHLIRMLGPYADYFTVNISSPNTPGLRKLQQKEKLAELLDRVSEARQKFCGKQDPPPLLIKLAPDLDEEQQQEIAQVLLKADIDGLILTNTTLDRPDPLPERFKEEAGGLSGKPLTNKSTDIIRAFYKLTNGKLPIIGVGGISSAEDAYEKIKAGASLVQLYSAMVFHGPEVVRRINEDLIRLIEQDGYSSVGQAVGADHQGKEAANAL